MMSAAAPGPEGPGTAQPATPEPAAGLLRGYQPQLDGLRALAVLAVVGFHSRVPLFSGGDIGVDVFFVLSGFLITSLLLDEHALTGAISMRRFMVRRALRLMPALLVVCMFTLVAYSAFHPFADRATLVGVPSSVFYVAGWIRGFSLSTLGWMGHTWSLSVEEHFYVVWPLVVALICRRDREHALRWIAAVFVLAVAYRSAFTLAGVSTARLYNSPDLRAEQILAGCLLAAWMRHAATRADALRTRWSILAVAASILLASLVPLLSHLHVYWYRGGSTVIALSAAVVIGYLVTWPSGAVAVLLAWAPLVWIGRRSYGIYLWHLPLLGLVYLPSEPNAIRAVSRAAMVLVTLAVAGVSFRYLEAPILKRRPR